MHTKKRTYMENLNCAKLMITGMYVHITELTKRGIGAEFIIGIQTTIANLEKSNTEREALKTAEETKMEVFDVFDLELVKEMAEAKRLVKMTTPNQGGSNSGLLANGKTN